MLDYENLLNNEQFDAVTAEDGPLLVLAAAGTGKTRTLTYRVAYLVEHGVPAENLLLLTFTNRAAKEMLERANSLTGNAISSLWGGTFHHVCNRMLRKAADRIGFQRDFVILDRDDSCKLIEQCINSITRNKKDFPKKNVIASMIGMAANRGCGIESVVEGQLDSLKVDPSEIVAVARMYAERKNELGMMDFDDLLINGLKLLKEHQFVREFYQEKFRHVLVDEYQDTNRMQAEMVDILAARNRSVMAVGDDFQCIYSWRGANFANIMDFPTRWPDCRIIKLERNYRSAPEILDVANASIRGNAEQFRRYPKELRAVRNSRRKPSFYLLYDGEEQGIAVSGLIRRYLEDGYQPKDVAVLYRAHFHVVGLEFHLRNIGVPYVVTSGVGVFELAHVKDVISFLRMCEFQTDYLSFNRLLGLLSGVGEKTIEKLWAKLGGKFDVTSTQDRETLLGLLRPAAREQWQHIDRLMGTYHLPSGDTISGPDVLDRFLEVFYRGYMARSFDNPEDREDDLRELANQLRKSASVREFLQEVSLLTNVDQEAMGIDGDKNNAVHLSTVHQAKGLEWPVVIIIWAVEGMFPSSRSMAENDDDTEERRLFYVAVTRARDDLVLCAPSMRYTRDGGAFQCKPSRFIKELPKGLLSERYGFRRY